MWVKERLSGRLGKLRGFFDDRYFFNHTDARAGNQGVPREQAKGNQKMAVLSGERELHRQLLTSSLLVGLLV